MSRLLRSAWSLPVLLATTTLLVACEPQEPPGIPGDPVAGNCKNVLPVIQGNGYRGVVLPSDTSRKTLRLWRSEVEDTFRPSDDVVRELEAGLREAVQARLAEASKQVASSARDKDVERMQFILKELPRVLRQYAGVVIGGARRVLVNAFPSDAYCYRDEFVNVADGGAQFWRVQYDLSLKQFVHWEVNPG